MLLPTTYQAELLLLIISMVCWGSWANAQKLTGKWRFELFYFDYALGVVICALVAAYTLGSANSADLTFTDNLLIAGRRKMAYGVAGGAVFNLANMVLVAALSVSGMAVAFPIAFGLALVIGVVRNYLVNPQGNVMLLFGGAVLVAVAIVVDAFAYSGYIDSQLSASKALPKFDSRTRKLIKPLTAARGIVLSLLSGIFMGLFYPLVEMGKSGDDGVGPYGIAVMFAAGVLITTVLYAPFFATFPVAGKPIELHKYFTGTKKQHLLGLAGGVIWAAGAIASFVAASAPPPVQVGTAIGYALGQGAALVSALWGLIVWREFKGADHRTRRLLAMMIALFLAGLGMVSIAPLYASK
jgi:glucose uptake protein